MRYTIVKAPGDGACMFNSIAIGILFNPKIKPTYKQVKELSVKLRKKAVQYMRKQIKQDNQNAITKMSLTYNYNMSNDNMSNDNNSNVTKTKAYKYTKEMAKSCTWGGHIELVALSEYIHKLGFKGIQAYEKGKSRLKVIPEMASKMNESKPKNVISILLHGVKHGGDHFDALIKKNHNFASVTV